MLELPLSTAGDGAVPSIVCPYHALLMTVASAAVRHREGSVAEESTFGSLQRISASRVGSYRHDSGSIRNPSSAPPQALMAAWVAASSFSGAMAPPRPCFIAIEA